MEDGPLALALTFVLAHPALGHALVALGLMAVTTPILQIARVPHPAALAAIGVSFFFYGREAQEAERFLLPAWGDPAAFFVALWPGTWTGGGASFWEWLAPTVTAMMCALGLRRHGRTTRDLRLGRE